MQFNVIKLNVLQVLLMDSKQHLRIHVALYLSNKYSFILTIIKCTIWNIVPELKVWRASVAFPIPVINSSELICSHQADHRWSTGVGLGNPTVKFLTTVLWYPPKPWSTTLSTCAFFEEKTTDRFLFLRVTTDHVLFSFTPAIGNMVISVAKVIAGTESLCYLLWNFCPK